MPTEDRRPFHRGLHRDAVIDAALDIVDREGRQALTMRSVASALDVQAASLYTHVRNKDDLTDGIIDRVMSQVEVPPDGPSSEWRTTLTAGFFSYRRALVRHPGVVGLLTERSLMTSAQRQLVSRSIALLEGSGMSIGEAGAAQGTLFAFPLGFIGQEVGRPLAAPPPEVLQSTDVLSRAMTALATTSVDERFEAGLAFIIDGATASRQDRR